MGSRKRTAIDLFCGCGGFSLGAHEAGFDVVRAYDNNPILTSSFERNFPNTKLRTKDVSRLTGAEIRQDIGGDVDLVFGGPPCQGFSAIGRRDKNDDRRKLLGHFFRLVAELHPAAFVMENVKGLGFADARHELDDSLALLPDSYVHSKPMVLDAADFGAATHRQRIFIIGYDPGRCEKIDFDALQKRRDAPATVRDAISDLSAAKATNDEGDIWELPEASDISDYAKALRAEDRRFTGNKRTRHTDKVVRRFATVPPGGMDAVGKHPRLSWDGRCPTLRAGTGSDMGSYQSVRPIHPHENRVITVREAARLQGFPDDHLFHPTIWHSFRMIGNSVSPIVAAAVLGAVAERLAVKEESKQAA